MAFILMALSCGGCANSGPDSDNLIITEKEPEGEQYNLAAASIGDVVLTKWLKCTYQQVEDQDVSFSVSGRQISRALVKVGDSVVKGQVLAELVDNQADSRIAELEYQIARNSLLLENIDTDESNEISARWLQFLYRSGKTEGEEEALKDSITQLQQNNQYQREDYQDAIDLDRMELESLRKENAVSRVYAEMDGTVFWMKENLEGSTCTRDEVIIRIIDSSECLFVVQGAEYADWFEEGVPVEMRITSGISAGRYTLMPYMMEEWGDRLTFSLLDDDNSAIEVGTTGTMEVVLDKREKVLTVPVDAVYMADDKPYVYVVGEGNMREVRWIKTGLHGDSSVEIIEGLEQGEKVILR